MKIKDILGRRSTTDTQLNKLGKHIFGKLFIGVFPSDKVPKLKVNEMCIINTDDSTQPGNIG